MAAKHKTAGIPFNRFKRAGNAIEYSVTRTDGGWKIQAHVPKQTPPDDRSTIIKWFSEYSSQVRKMHPFWMTRFIVSETGYELNVQPADNARELLEKGQNLKDIWSDEIATLA